ncbi:MAG TPA: hypothetical protein VIE65_07235 [Methylobacter sp.]
MNALILLVFLPACAHVQTGMIDQALQPLAPNIVVVSQPVGKGYYAVVEKIDGRWHLVSSLQTQPITNRDNDQQEILFVNRNLRSIAPSFDPRVNTGESTECTPYIQDNRVYGLCYSYFGTSDIGTSIGRNIVSCALTLCLAAGTREILDHEKVQEVVIESDLINVVKKRIAAEDRSDYLAMFSNALKSNDAGQLEAFIGRYRNNDPNGLVPQAVDRIRTIKETDAMYSKLTSEIDHAKEKPNK